MPDKPHKKRSRDTENSIRPNRASLRMLYGPGVHQRIDRVQRQMDNLYKASNP